MVKRYSMFRNPQPWRSVQGPEDEPSLEAKKATDRNHSAYVVMVEEKARLPSVGFSWDYIQRGAKGEDVGC